MLPAFHLRNLCNVTYKKVAGVGKGREKQNTLSTQGKGLSGIIAMFNVKSNRFMF